MYPNVAHTTTSCMVLLRSHPLCRYFSPIDFDILRTLIFISLLYKVRSSSGAVYCVPGQKYLAQKCLCHRVTISHHISNLKEIGFIDPLRRRPVKGRFTTNLYRFGKLLWSLIWEILKKSALLGHRVALPLHKGTDTPRTHTSTPYGSSENGSLNENSPGLALYLQNLTLKIIGSKD